tara:strand:+ start:1787 stop:2425 length:639 start_codon:yes stop_codon:yes gene_type:complete
MIKIKNFILGLDFKSLLIVGLVILLLLTRMCSSGSNTSASITKADSKKYEMLKHTTDTIFITKTTIQYKPGNTIYKEVKAKGVIPLNVSKDSIAKEYYTTNVYKDTIKLKDNQGYVSLVDTIFNNNIIGRTWDAKITSSVISDKTILNELPKNQIYLGGVMGFDKKNIANFVGPSLLIKTKKDHIYSLGVGYGANQVLSLQGGIYWKIKIGK